MNNLKQTPSNIPHHIKFADDYEVVNMTGKGFSGKLSKDEVILYDWLETSVFKMGQTEGEGFTPEEAFINRYKSAESAFGGSSIVVKRLFICNKKDFPSQREQYDKQFHNYINLLHDGNPKKFKFYFPGDKSGNTERFENFSISDFSLLETCLGNFLKVDGHYLKLDLFTFKNKMQDFLFNLAMKVLKKYKQCLFNIVTGFGKSTLVPKFVVEIYKILSATGNKNKKVFLFTSPIVDTIAGIIAKVLTKDYGFKIKVFTNDDVIRGNITKFIDKAISEGYLILLIFSVQNLRFRDNVEQNKKQIRKKFAFLSKYNLGAWIRDERHVEYNGIITSEIFKNITAEYIVDLTATSFKLLNSFSEYKVEQIVKFDILDALLEKSNGNADFQKFPTPKMECIDFNCKINDKRIYEIYEDEDGYNEKKLYQIEKGKMVHEKEFIEINRLKYDGIYLNDGKIIRASKKKNSFAIYSDPEVDNKSFGMKLVPEGNSEMSTQEIQEIAKEVLNRHIKYYHFITAKEFLKKKESSSYEEAINFFLNIARSLNKDGFVILSHDQMTTGSDLIPLGFEDWDRKISSVDPFFQTIGRMTREFEGKNTVKCYFNVPNMELSYAECVVSAVKEKTSDIQKQREYYDLIPISMMSEQGPIKLSFEETLKNYHKNIAEMLSKKGPSASVLSKLPNIIEYLKNSPFDKLKSDKGSKKDNITPETEAKTTKSTKNDADSDINDDNSIFIDKDIDNTDESEKVPVKDKNRLDTISSMLWQGIEIAIVEGKYDIKDVFQYKGMTKLFFSKKNIDLMNYVLKNEEYYHILNDWVQKDVQDFSKLDLKDVVLEGKLFLNQPFKSKMGLVYMPTELSQTIVKKIVEYSENPEKIAVVNALDGKLPLMLQKIYPNAEIICIEYFDYYIEHLKKLGFKVCKAKVIGKELIFPKELKDMKFDVIVGNPPYQKGTADDMGRNALLWPEFVKKSFEYLKENGFLCFVHPSLWRKPEHEIWKILTEKQVVHLDIHSKQEAELVFGVTTRYDWYVVENVNNYKKTIIVDQKKKVHKYDLKECKFLPNYNIEMIFDIVSNSYNELNIISDSSYHAARKDIVSKIKNKEFKYPIVNTITKSGPNIIWSNRNTSGHFFIPKVIVNDGDNLYPILDIDGQYGMSSHCFAIPIKSKKEGKLIINSINSKKFKEIINATKWSNFQTDWRMFKYFKKDFWKYFVDENGNEI